VQAVAIGLEKALHVLFDPVVSFHGQLHISGIAFRDVHQKAIETFSRT
jgi:hypothetical protein